MGKRALVCLFRGHKWSEMQERGDHPFDLDHFRICDRCGRFWKMGLWIEEIPPPPTPPPPRGEFDPVLEDANTMIDLPPILGKRVSNG